MTLTPHLHRLGLVLLGMGLVMGPIADPRHVTVVHMTAALLLASCSVADLFLLTERRSPGRRLLRNDR